MWSDVHTVQIIGRVHRLGQKNTVRVYRITALKTTDVVMSSMAREKNEMLEALVSTAPNES